MILSIATSTCEITSTSSNCAYTINITEIIQYLGSLNFGIAIVITILFISIMGYIFNKITPKKPWR